MTLSLLLNTRPTPKSTLFPYTTLFRSRKKAGITKAEVDAEIPAEVRERGPLNWGWVQAILKVIDRRVPFGSGASVALFTRSEEHTSELQSQSNIVCRLLLVKKIKMISI